MFRAVVLRQSARRLLGRRPVVASGSAVFAAFGLYAFENVWGHGQKTIIPFGQSISGDSKDDHDRGDRHETVDLITDKVEESDKQTHTVESDFRSSEEGSRSSKHDDEEVIQKVETERTEFSNSSNPGSTFSATTTPTSSTNVVSSSITSSSERKDDRSFSSSSTSTVDHSDGYSSDSGSSRDSIDASSGRDVESYAIANDTETDSTGFPGSSSSARGTTSNPNEEIGGSSSSTDDGSPRQRRTGRNVVVCEEASELAASRGSRQPSLLISTSECKGKSLLRRLLRMACRWFTVCIFFTPVVWLSIPYGLLWKWGGRDIWYNMLLNALQRSGPTFIKLGQWAATRKDLLPADLCDALSRLHSSVEPHNFEFTDETLTQVFGPRWRDKIRLDEESVGSGCIAQVYRGDISTTVFEERHSALVSKPRKELTPIEIPVAVKVLHPAVRETIQVDLEIMGFVANAIETYLPLLSFTNLSSAVDQFAAFLEQQTDLRIEAKYTCMFRDRFPEADYPQIKFPQIYFASSDILVESFEFGLPMNELLQGDKIEELTPKSSRERSNVVRRKGSTGKWMEILVARDKKELSKKAIYPGKFMEELGDLALNTYLKMLFHDFFVHGDLHPGNMLWNVREDGKPELVYLDCGLAIELNDRDSTNFADCVYAILHGSSESAGRLIMDRSPQESQIYIRDPDEFTRRVGKLITEFRRTDRPVPMNVAEVTGTLLLYAGQHQVTLETNFVNVALSLAVMDGLGRQLNGDFNIFRSATPFLAKAALRYQMGYKPNAA